MAAVTLVSTVMFARLPRTAGADLSGHKVKAEAAE